MEKVEIYPSTVSDIASIKDLQPVNMKRISTAERMLPFAVYLDKKFDKVHYFKKDYDHKAQSHLCTLQRAFENSDEDVKSWYDVSNRLSNRIIQSNYTDRRVCYKYNSNFFIVKKYFTTGIRTAEPDHWHCFQIGKHPLMLCFIEKPKACERFLETRLRHFRGADEWSYCKQKLEPNSIYLLPEDYYYIVIAYSYAHFSLHKLKKTDQVPFQYKDLNYTLPTPFGPDYEAALPIRTIIEDIETPNETPLIEEINDKRRKRFKSSIPAPASSMPAPLNVLDPSTFRMPDVSSILEPSNIDLSAPGPSNIDLSAPGPSNIDLSAPGPSNIDLSAPGPSNIDLTAPAPSPSNTAFLAQAPFNTAPSTSGPSPYNTAFLAQAPFNTAPLTSGPFRMPAPMPSNPVTGFGVRITRTILLGSVETAKWCQKNFIYHERGAPDTNLPTNDNTPDLEPLDLSTSRPTVPLHCSPISSPENLDSDPDDPGQNE